MIGFMPGFPYMGMLDHRLYTHRKPKPENVTAGAVGIAGYQTGIYPFDSPGGWHIIGCTPLKMFDPDRENPVLMQPGQKVKFHSITLDEYQDYQGRNS